MTALDEPTTLTFSRRELLALRDALSVTVLWYGPVPDPPTPAMTARAKVAEALAAGRAVAA